MHWFGQVIRRLGSRLVHPSAAGAAVMAVVVALGVSFVGSSTAAVLIGSRQIKDGSITAVDVHNGSVRGVDVRDHSLAAADVLGGAPQGPQGPDGPPGGPGAPGSAILQYPIEARTIADPPGTPVVRHRRAHHAPDTRVRRRDAATDRCEGVRARHLPEERLVQRIAHDSGVNEDIHAFGWAVCVNQS